MVFHFRCFSFDYEAKAQAKSTSTETFYTASSDLNRSKSYSLRTSNLVLKRTNLRVFTIAELKAATSDFGMSSKIGEGEFWSVYKGTIKSSKYPYDDIQVAVKLANGRLMGHRKWLREATRLGVVEHPNLVKLIGYCVEDDESEIQRILVYEYMPNGSVEDCLSSSSKTPLSWTMRLNGLSGTFTSHKKIETGHLTAECDVWSYGCFLYELITGRLPLGKNRANELHLVKRVKSYIDSKRFRVTVDPRLEDNYSMKSAKKLLIIADRCLSKNPKSRPNMSEVVEMIDKLTSKASNLDTYLGSLVRVAFIKLKKVFRCTS